jgi:hypothetical protein
VWGHAEADLENWNTAESVLSRESRECLQADQSESEDGMKELPLVEAWEAVSPLL